MKCKNLFCAFSRRNGECVKKYVSFDETGMCEHIFYPKRLKGMPDSMKERYIKLPKDSFYRDSVKKEIILYILTQELRGIKNKTNDQQDEKK